MSFSFNCWKCQYPIEVDEESAPDGRIKCPQCRQHYSLPISEEDVREQATQAIATAKQRSAAPQKTQTPAKPGAKLKFKIKAPPRTSFKI